MVAIAPFSDQTEPHPVASTGSGCSFPCIPVFPRETPGSKSMIVWPLLVFSWGRNAIYKSAEPGKLISNTPVFSHAVKV